jgi:hypothetical protein
VTTQSWFGRSALKVRSTWLLHADEMETRRQHRQAEQRDCCQDAVPVHCAAQEVSRTNERDAQGTGSLLNGVQQAGARAAFAGT